METGFRDRRIGESVAVLSGGELAEEGDLQCGCSNNTINPDQYNKEKGLEIYAFKLRLLSSSFTIICI